MPEPASISDEQAQSAAQRILSHAKELLDLASNPRDLHVLTERMIIELVQRNTDRELRDKTLGHVDHYYSAKIAAGGPPAKLLAEGKAFSAEVISMLVRVRRKRGEEQPAAEEIKGYLEEEKVAVTDPSPPAPEPSVIEGPQSELLAVAPTSVVIVPPPKPENHSDFQLLLAAALRFRVGSTTSYFQRWNPRVNRSMPLPFLLSVPFGQRLDVVIEEVITPAMLTSRAIRAMGTSYNWNEVDSETFWKLAQDNGHYASLRSAWMSAWDGLRPRAEDRKGETIIRVSPALRDLRKRLAGEEYAIPRLGNHELDLLASFLDPEYARAPLENAWTKLRQNYEQELDRRVYQDQARSGALRDSLLACFKPFTNPTAEFLAMLCYWNFPYLSLSFLTAFTHNHGTNHEARLRRIPYLLWYLDQPGAEAALAQDEAAIESAKQKADQLRKELREQESLQRDAQLGGLSWGKKA